MNPSATLAKVTLFCFILSLPSYGNSFQLNKQRRNSAQRGAEYISGDNYKTSLMKVSLVGEVNKPGTHLVPSNSKLSDLIAFAGGPTKDAELDEISIRRASNKSLAFNFEDFMQGKTKDLNLASNDYIHVKKKESFWDTKTLTIVSTILGIVVSGIVIEDKL